MQQLNWKPVHEYEGFYEINESGEIRSLYKRNFENILPQRIDRGGYFTVKLDKKGKCATRYVHRLLGFAFIPNKEDKPFINHIDGNKLNNSLENLEWVTHSENMKHAYKLKLSQVPQGKCKKVIDTCSGHLYLSISHASRDLGIPYSTCKNYLNGNRHNPTCLRYAS